MQAQIDPKHFENSSPNTVRS